MNFRWSFGKLLVLSFVLAVVALVGCNSSNKTVAPGAVGDKSCCTGDKAVTAFVSAPEPAVGASSRVAEGELGKDSDASG